MINKTAFLVAIASCANSTFAQGLESGQQLDDEPEGNQEQEIESEGGGLSWNIGGTTFEVSGNAALGLTYKDGEPANASNIGVALGISREIGGAFVLGADFSVSSESFFGDSEEEGSNDDSLPVDIVIYAETQIGTLSYGDVGNALDELVQNVGDGASLDAEADILYAGYFGAFGIAASYDFDDMNDYAAAASYETDSVMFGLGYGAADEVGYYTVSAGTTVGDASIIASYTANDNDEISYGAELGYSISEVELGAAYSFYNDENSYELGAAYQLEFGPILQVGWSSNDGVSAGLSYEF